MGIRKDFFFDDGLVASKGKISYVEVHWLKRIRSFIEYFFPVGGYTKRQGSVRRTRIALPRECM